MALLTLHQAADVDGLAEAILPRRATVDQREAARAALLAANPSLADGATAASGSIVVVPVVEGIRADLTAVGAPIGAPGLPVIARLEHLEADAAAAHDAVVERISLARALVTKARRARSDDASLTADEAAGVRADLDAEAARIEALQRELEKAQPVWAKALAELAALRHGTAG